MDKIAKQLDVSKKTISLDLRDIVTPGNNVRQRSEEGKCDAPSLTSLPNLARQTEQTRTPQAVA